MNARMMLVATAMGLTALASTAQAIPLLQLDIGGGSYDPAETTTFTTADTFTLYAYLTPQNNCNANCLSSLLSTPYYISAALTPQTGFAGGNFGSFSYSSGGTTTVVDATGDMVYGVPPIERNGTAAFDAGDLGKHSVFPTYFSEIPFLFQPANVAAKVDVAGSAGAGPQAGTGMYYAAINFDLSNLAAGYDLHFDLYNELFRKNDTDIKNFAPFSHDAESRRAVPEPSTLTLLGLGLVGIGFMARRRRGI